MGSTQKSITKNYLFNLSYQLLLILVPIITTPYVSRVLGADGIGIYSYSNSIAAYFVLLATLGSSTFGQREISYVQENEVKRSAVFTSVILFRLICCIISLGFYLLLVETAFEGSAIYLILAVNVLSVAFDVTWFFQGLEEFGKIVLRNAVFKILNVIYIFVFIRTPDDLLLYVGGLSIITLLGHISLWPYLKRYVSRFSFKLINLAEVFKGSIALFIPALAIQVYLVLDKTMIGIITQNPYENGCYEQAEKIAKLTMTLVTSLSTVMLPRIGSLHAQNDVEGVRYYMYKSCRFLWCFGWPLCLGLIGISANFVPWFFGDGFDKVVPLMRILSLVILANGLNSVLGTQYLIAVKRQRAYTASVITGAVVDFFLNLILIPLFQSEGAAIATVAAESSVAIVQLVCVKRDFDIKMMIGPIWRYILSGACMLLVLLVINHYLNPGIAETLMLILSGATVYCLFLLIFRDDFFIDNCIRVLRKIQHLLRGR